MWSPTCELKHDFFQPLPQNAQVPDSSRKSGQEKGIQSTDAKRWQLVDLPIMLSAQVSRKILRDIAQTLQVLCTIK